MEIEIGAVLETHDSQRPTFATRPTRGTRAGSDYPVDSHRMYFTLISGIFGRFKIRKKAPEFHTIIFVWA